MLCRHRVHEPLSPPCGGACESAQLSSLQVFEASDHQPGLHDPLAIDYLPLQDPAGVNDVSGVLLLATLERSEVQPPLELVEHRLVARLLVLKCLVAGANVILPFDDRPLDPGRVAADHIVVILVDQLRQHFAVGWRHE